MIFLAGNRKPAFVYGAQRSVRAPRFSRSPFPVLRSPFSCKILILQEEEEQRSDTQLSRLPEGWAWKRSERSLLRRLYTGTEGEALPLLMSPALFFLNLDDFTAVVSPTALASPVRQMKRTAFRARNEAGQLQLPCGAASSVSSRF